MKKKSLLILTAIFFMPSFLALVGGLSSFWGKQAGIFAQQLPFSSQYYTNSFVVNPAFTGNGDYINAFLTHRSQWTGLAGAPQTSYLTVDGPMLSRNSGLGLKVYTDVTDIISRVGAFGNYSYKLRLNDSSHILFGVAMGALGNKLDFSKAIIKDNNDPFLYQQSKSRTIFSADLGVAYVWKRLTVGFAIPQVLGNHVKYTILNDDNSYYNLSRHYHGTIKYEFDLVKDKGLTAYPLVMVRAVKGGPFQYDINGVVDWKNKGWVGLTYHSTYALAISAGARYKNFIFGYAYDIGVNKVRSYLGTTSEFLLGYTFAERKKRGPDNMDDSGRDTLMISKSSRDTIYSIVAAQMKAMADSNKAEVARLKSELEKAKSGEGSASTSADGKPLAYISGRLLDEQGNPVPGAQAEVVNKSNNQVVARPFTNEDGTVRIAVPAGQTYDVVFNKSGYLYKPMNVTVPETAGFEWSLKDVTMQKLEVGKKVVLNNIQFDLNKATIKSESYSELDQTVRLIKDIPSLEMEVSGHTDNVGSANGNKELSEQRAKAVMDYLVSKGCDQSRLSYKGYGASQPIADNNTDSGRKLNRRTEFKVLKVDGQYDIVAGGNTTKATPTTAATSVNSASNDAAIAQLKAKSDTYEQQIEQLRQELAKVKTTTATVPASTENPALAAQLKAMSDSNQVQIERLKAELAKTKSATGSADEARIAQLQSKADSNQEQINLLKAELAKSKSTSTTVEDSRLSQLKAKSDSNQVQIDALKAELAKTKSATTTNDDARIAQLKAKSDSTQVQLDRMKAELVISKSLSGAAEDARIAKLKSKSDSNQVEIERIKAELAKTKSTATAAEDTRVAELKAKSDSNQEQIEALKAELAKSKLASTSTEDARIAQLKAKSDSNQVQIDALKAELAKSKTAMPPKNDDARLAQLKAKSDSNQVQIDLLRAELALSKVISKPTTTEDPQIEKLKVKADTNQRQIEQLKWELTKVKLATMSNTANSDNTAAVAQLKAKADSNQVQIDALKAELAKAKAAEPKTSTTTQANDASLAELKSKSDSYQAEIDKLKAELEKVKASGTTTPANTDGNDVSIALLKTSSYANQAEIDKLKAELEKLKVAGTANTPATTQGSDASIAQLKTTSDANQAEIDKLKAELEKLKAAGTAAPASTQGNDAAIAQLKSKSDSYQTEIEQLKAELAKLKGNASATNTASAETERQLALLKAKADADQAEINRLKAEQEKAKTNSANNTATTTANTNTTNTNTTNTNATNPNTTTTTTATTTPTTSTPGVRTYKTTDFLDDKGKPVTTGFYVIIGTFGSKENADKFRATSVMKGHGTTKIIQNQNSKVFNITIVKTNNKEDADTERAKYKTEYPDLWILKLE